MLLAGAGFGSDSRNAYISARSRSDSTFVVYGGISPVVVRTYDSRAPGKPRVVAANSRRPPHVVCVQLILAQAVIEFGGHTSFQRSLQPASANHGACGQLRRARGVSGCGKSLTLRRIDARFARGDSGVRRDGDAAIAGVRPTGSADDGIHIVWCATSSGEPLLRGLAASERWAETRTAATSARAVTRDDWRLDFRARSGKTAHGRPRWPRAGPRGPLSKKLCRS